MLVDFFRNKGLEALKREDRQEEWYQDWIDYQAKHKLYANVLSPKRYSTLGNTFDLARLARFLETFAYCSPAHAYSLHVTFLGLFPILMSSNEDLKKEAIAKLENGGLFAFGVSEKAHGSDLLANEFTVQPTDTSSWVADGWKYYIGNANVACIISILGKKLGGPPTHSARRAPFVLFALRPTQSPAMRSVRKIRTLGIRSAFVAEFEVRGHSFPQGDVIALGRDAWDTIANTVNFGKFLLGFGAIGIVGHAFAEAIDHLRRRILYGKPVIEMPHIQNMTAHAFARLLAMKLFAYRALDYVQAATPDDRRYLLFNAVQKAKVSTEGVKVMSLLSECINARGFESETYFESALREATMVPGLEGSTHINYRLASQFTELYFAAGENDAATPALPMHSQTEVRENPYWFAARERSAKTVRFGHFLHAFRPLSEIVNVHLFVEQVEAFHRFVGSGDVRSNATADVALSIAIGKCLSTIAYAQLIAERCRAMEVSPAVISVIFHCLIEDLSAESLKLSALFPRTSVHRSNLRRLMLVPETSPADFACVCQAIATRYS